VKLRTQLVGLTLATLLPVAVFGAAVGYLLVQEQRETFRRGAEDRALAISTALDGQLTSHISSLNALSRVESLASGDLRYFRATAQRVLAGQRDWININLALPSGERIEDLLAPEGAALPPIQRFEKSFERVVQTLRPTVGDLARGPVSERWTHAVRVPVTQEGELRYVLSAILEPPSVARLLQQQNIPEGWVAVVLDGSDRIVARTVDPAGSIGQLASQSLREALSRLPSGWFEGSTIEGTRVYTPYRRSAETGWTFAMGIPAPAFEAAATRALWFLAAGLLGAIALAVAAAYAVSRRLAAPIAELARASEALAKGEAARVPQTAPVDEVRLLARSFQECIDAMRASEERLRMALAAGKMGNWEWDVRTSKVAWSPDLEAIHGLAPGTFPGTFAAYEKDVHPEDRDAVRRAIARNLEGGDDHHIEYRIVRADGIVRWVEGRGRVYRDGAGAPLRVVGVCTDITERKRVEEALRAADRAKDEFLATLSHELRNPLAALTAAAHVLKVSDPAQAPAVKARGVIERQTRHMARLIADLLDIGRVSAGKIALERVRLELSEAVRRVVDVWRQSGRFERHKVRLDAEAVWVDADRARLEQIVANLLDNALKFTPAGKRISASVRAEGEAAVLRIADEGIGIEPAERARLFQLFVQGKHGVGGMGVGLALVKRLVELHGGEVSATSEGEGRGAAFTVRLPAVLQPAAPSSPVLAAAAPRSVLLVEDNDDARQMLEAALASGGHAVRAARDGASGLALAAESPPDIALIDIGLPDMDGYEVARRIRSSPGGRAVSLVAITGYGRAEDQERAFAAGFDAHLTKPVTADRLRQTDRKSVV